MYIPVRTLSVVYSGELIFSQRTSVRQRKLLYTRGNPSANSHLSNSVMALQVQSRPKTVQYGLTSELLRDVQNSNELQGLNVPVVMYLFPSRFTSFLIMI